MSNSPRKEGNLEEQAHLIQSTPQARAHDVENDQRGDDLDTMSFSERTTFITSLAVSTALVTLGLFTSSQAILRQETLLPLPPEIAFITWLILLVSVGIVEGQQAAIMSLMSLGREQIPQDYRGVQLLFDLFDDVNLIKFINSCQFLLKLFTVMATLITTPRQYGISSGDGDQESQQGDKEGNVLNLPQWFATCFVDTGILGSLAFVCLGRLTAQILAIERMMDYLNTVTVRVFVHFTLAIEFSGVLHFNFLLQELIARGVTPRPTDLIVTSGGGSRNRQDSGMGDDFYLAKMKQDIRFSNSLRGTIEAAKIESLEGLDTITSQIPKLNLPFQSIAKHDAGSTDQQDSFVCPSDMKDDTVELKELFYIEKDVMYFVRLALSTSLISFSCVLLLPAVVFGETSTPILASSYLSRIFFLVFLMVIIGLIDGIQISIMTILNSGGYLEGCTFQREAHPHVQRICNFLFSGNRLPSFLIGRLVLASFVVGWLGRSTTLMPSTNEAAFGLQATFPKWFIFLFIRSGFCPTLLIMTSSVIGRTIATLKPVTFLSMCGNTMIIFVCLGLEQTGVTKIIWYLADLIGSMCCLRMEYNMDRHNVFEPREAFLTTPRQSPDTTQQSFEGFSRDTTGPISSSAFKSTGEVGRSASGRGRCPIAGRGVTQDILGVQKTNVTRYAMKSHDWKQKAWHLEFME